MYYSALILEHMFCIMTFMDPYFVTLDTKKNSAIDTPVVCDASRHCTPAMVAVETPSGLFWRSYAVIQRQADEFSEFLQLRQVVLTAINDFRLLRQADGPEISCIVTRQLPATDGTSGTALQPLPDAGGMEDMTAVEGSDGVLAVEGDGADDAVLSGGGECTR